MRGLFNRALPIAAGIVAILATALPSPMLAASVGANVSGITTPSARLAGSFALNLPVLLPAVSTGPQDLSRYATDEIASQVYLFDGLSLDTGFNIDVARMLDRYAPTAGAYDGLFYSSAATSSPYVALSSGGSYVGLTMALADSVHFSLGQASTAPGLNPYLLNPRTTVAALGGAGLTYDTRHTSSTLAGVSWNFAKWGVLGFSASQTTEHDGTLENSELNTARTSALGVSANVGFGGGWVTTASYSEGHTQLDLRPFAAGAESSLHSQSYGIAVAKHGLFGNDALGVAFSRPAPGYSDNNFIPTGTSSDMQFFGRDKLFAGTAPETDIELGYVTHFLDSSVALQANAAYQMNFGGQTGNNAVSLLSRAKIKF